MTNDELDELVDRLLEGEAPGELHTVIRERGAREYAVLVLDADDEVDGYSERDVIRLSRRLEEYASREERAR